ncbi:MAG: redoxin domain-containing protein [Acidobacteriaceae bacterium]|nr:redoxin domain-containing protein [Acidobacteriaceae bacterium]
MKIHRRQFMTSAATLAASALGLVPRLSFSSRLPVEGRVPSLKHAVGWLNSPPLELTDLRGDVVLINFWTYTCINSLRTLPYVRAWAEKYKQEGLVTIGVHIPEFGFEHEFANVRTAAAGLRVDYPIAIDSNYEIWRAFGNEYWPAFYFVDASGRIRHHQFGEGEYDRSERVIQGLLNEAGKRDDNHELVFVRGEGIEAAPDWNSLRSPETYIGLALSRNFAGAHSGRSYKMPSQLQLNHWALEGDWTRGEETAVLKQSNGRVAFCFHARDLHLVMAPPAPGTSVRFRVSIEGRQPGAAHGGDIDGRGNGSLSQPRLYQLIRQPEPVIDRQFEIEFLDPGAQVLDFTFG